MLLAKSWSCACVLVAAPLAAKVQQCQPTAPQAAPSDRGQDLAEQHFETGEAAFISKRWEVASIEFQAAYALSHQSDLLYNLSVTAEKAGKLAEAIDLAFRHLCDASAMPQTDAYAARSRLARLRETLKTGALGPQPEPPVAPIDPAPSRPSDRPGGRLPPGGVALVGAGLLLIGIGCDAGAIATGQAFNGDPLTLSQINDLTSKGNALQGAAISLDVLGGLALTAGAG